MKKWLIEYIENEFGKRIAKYKIKANTEEEALKKAEKRYKRWKGLFHKSDAYYTKIKEI